MLPLYGVCRFKKEYSFITWAFFYSWYQNNKSILKFQLNLNPEHLFWWKNLWTQKINLDFSSIYAVSRRWLKQVASIRGVAKKANISKTVPVTPVHGHEHGHDHDHDHDHGHDHKHERNWVACNKQTCSRRTGSTTTTTTITATTTTTNGTGSPATNKFVLEELARPRPQTELGGLQQTN